MKKLLITLLISTILVSGCTIKNVSDESVSDIFNTILFVDNNLSNLNMNGYSLYLPQGVKLVDKSDYNLILQDHNRKYYLYVDTIAYYYKIDNKYQENSASFYSKKFESNGKKGYIDVQEKDKYYYVVAMYNYVKIETYVDKDEFNDAMIRISSILSTVKYNDTIIAGYVGNNGKTVLQEEKFNIFDTNTKDDNFLKYESEYGTYKETIVINDGSDIIDVDEVID